MIDAPSSQIPGIASVLRASGIHASFALDHVPTAVGPRACSTTATRRFRGSPTVVWSAGSRPATSCIILLHSMGFGRHFLYASSGPSVGQWLVAHGAGGRLIAGAVRIDEPGDIGRPPARRRGHRADGRNPEQVLPMLDKLSSVLHADHLSAVPVGRLMHDAGSAV